MLTFRCTIIAIAASFLLASSSLARVVVCEAVPEDELASAIQTAYERAELVVEVDTGSSLLFGITKFSVARVWKGSVGEQIYLRGSGEGNGGIIFANRDEEYGPIRDFEFGDFCGTPSETVHRQFIQAFGTGYPPSADRRETAYSAMWPLFIAVALFLCAAASVFAWRLLRPPSK